MAGITISVTDANSALLWLNIGKQIIGAVRAFQASKQQDFTPEQLQTMRRETLELGAWALQDAAADLTDSSDLPM